MVIAIPLQRNEFRQVAGRMQAPKIEVDLWLLILSYIQIVHRDI